MSTHSHLSAALGGPGTTVFGWASQGALGSAVVSEGSVREYKSTTEFTIDGTVLNGHLIAGFIDDQSFGTGFSTLDIAILDNGVALMQQHFTTLSQANSFTDNAIDLAPSPARPIRSSTSISTSSPATTGPASAIFLLGVAGGTAAFAVRILGTAQVGQALTAEVTGGTARALQWQELIGSKWVNIAGAIVAPPCAVTEADEGHRLRVVATPTVADGGTKAISTATKLVTDAPPELTVDNNSLVLPKGGSIDLGVAVLVPDADDSVLVVIRGLTAYESIADNLDHQTFAGGAGPITLTAAEVNSGLTLTSSYKGKAQPVNKLTLTPTSNSAGETIKGPSQTITVTDPPVALLAQYMASVGVGSSASRDAGFVPPQSQTATVNLVSPLH